jgi:hypothetical protein
VDARAWSQYHFSCPGDRCRLSHNMSQFRTFRVLLYPEPTGQRGRSAVPQGQRVDPFRRSQAGSGHRRPRKPSGRNTGPANTQEAILQARHYDRPRFYRPLKSRSAEFFERMAERDSTSPLETMLALQTCATDGRPLFDLSLFTLVVRPERVRCRYLRSLMRVWGVAASSCRSDARRTRVNRACRPLDDQAR